MRKWFKKVFGLRDKRKILLQRRGEGDNTFDLQLLTAIKTDRGWVVCIGSNEWCILKNDGTTQGSTRTRNWVTFDPFPELNQQANNDI